MEYIVIKKYSGRMRGENYSYIGILEDINPVPVPQAVIENGENVWQNMGEYLKMTYGSYGHGFTTYIARPFDELNPRDLIGLSLEKLYEVLTIGTE